MVNHLPAIIIGGPPHAGKSVLLYSITHALQQRGVAHHAIRACPDGEGNWSQETDQSLVSQIRSKGAWSDEFVQGLCRDLEHRCLPLLVDMGGRPTASQTRILRQCSHVLLLLRADQPDYTEMWQRLSQECNLTPLARIYSQVAGASTLTAKDPVIEGSLTGLSRDNKALPAGPVFEALIDRIVEVFRPSSPQALEQLHCEQAPTTLIKLSDIVPGSERWEPALLPPFMASLSAQHSYSVYGRAPAWVYASIIARTKQPLFYQFDPRLGWIPPWPVHLSDSACPEVEQQLQIYQAASVLALTLPSKHLEYFQPESQPFLAVPVDRGLILDGPLPLWLCTALTRLYKIAGVSWIALYNPREHTAVVVYSRVAAYQPGDCLAIETLFLKQ